MRWCNLCLAYFRFVYYLNNYVIFTFYPDTSIPAAKFIICIILSFYFKIIGINFMIWCSMETHSKHKVYTNLRRYSGHHMIPNAVLRTQFKLDIFFFNKKNHLKQNYLLRVLIGFRCRIRYWEESTQRLFLLDNWERAVEIKNGSWIYKFLKLWC